MIPAPASRRRFLPAVPAGFELGDREPLARGLRRITVDQFDEAMTALSTGELGAGVHGARKSLKRLRSILRLVRAELGDDRYRAENAMLRDTARIMAPVRDADARIATVRGLRDRFAEQLRASAFEQLEHVLLSRRERIHRDPGTGDDVRRVVYALRAGRARYSAWPIERSAAKAHGVRVIDHDFAAVGPGLHRTYARGREEMAQAVRSPTADNHHQWRKRTKYLRHQLEVLHPIWPDVVEGHVRSLDRLGELLGEEHDLAELLRFVASTPGACPDPLERSLLTAIAQHRRAELQAAARTLGARVYAEPAPRFTARFERYWDAWDEPIPVGFVE